MIKNISPLKYAVVVATMIVPITASATNGMFLIAASNKSRSMGGLGIAYADNDAVAMAANPAHVANSGTRFDVDGIIFKPTVSSKLGIGTSNEVSADVKANGIGIDNIFMMGGAGLTGNIDKKWDYGFAFVAVGGGVTQYTENFFLAVNNKPNEGLGVNLMVGNMLSTLSYRINDKHTLGASFIFGIQRFRAYGLSEFTQFTAGADSGIPTTGLTDNDNQFRVGAGLRFGWLADYGKLDVGVVLTTETYFQKFDKYDQLFAEQGSLNTPPSFGVGVSYEFDKSLTLAADITHTLYSQVPAISNRGPNLPGDPDGPFPGGDKTRFGLGADDGFGFGWEDQTVIKLGAAYVIDDEWTARAGWNYGKSPIDESTETLFNIMAPAVTQHHLTLGATWHFYKDMELSGSFVHAFEYEHEGPTFIGVRGSSKMSQNSFGVGFGMPF